MFTSSRQIVLLQQLLIDHWLGKWINTSVSHNQHHQYFKENYGLYFTIWDRMMGTLRPDYDDAFETLKKRSK